MNYTQSNQLAVNQIVPPIVDLVIPLLDKHFPYVTEISDLPDLVWDQLYEDIQSIIGGDYEMECMARSLFSRMIESYLRWRVVCRSYAITEPKEEKSL